jgi:N utilization substance protein A
MKSDFILAFNEIVEARGLPKEKVLEALKQALVSAYRRDARVIESQRIEAEIDEQGHPRLMVEKEVTEDVVNPQTEVALSEIATLYPDAQLGDMVMVPVTTLSKTFGRIAAQTAKQVILQHIREAEREALYTEYIDREGELTIGTVQSISPTAITLDLGRAEAIMPISQRPPNEHYRHHEKIRVYVAEVKRSNRGPQIIVSRNHKNMLRRLLEYEVPEIYNGQIEIKSIAREAGYRSKVAVAALQEGIDAVGACVGMRGMRIQNIVKELNDEKIDVIEWDPDPAKFIARALSPARVSKVFLSEEIDSVRTATVIVPEDQLSLAIGKEGQNARLAAKLTGWRIDIKSVMEAAQEAMNRIEVPPLNRLLETHDALLAETYRILDKRANNRVITPEEYTSVRQFVELAVGILHEKHEEILSERREMIEAVRPLVPEVAFEIPLEELELAEDIMEVIGRLGNVGELWVRYMADEAGLERSLLEGGAGEDAMDAIRFALDDLVLPTVEELAAKKAQAAESVEVAVEEAEAPQPAEPVEALPEVEVPQVAAEAPAVGEAEEVGYEDYMEEVEDEDEGLDDLSQKEKKKSKKKAKQKRRQLIYDEDVGEVVARRRRKREQGEFDDYDEYF